ncbi:peptidase U32 family protein [Geovibrio ferrireducens]|uniref:peptidase U32 family protein n=1 Tax=Geovibrio ferrireducens TaxID=46201 RepID=UPI0022484EB2|nr:U32 family peptidase [Geovibrio ferrireducens]
MSVELLSPAGNFEKLKYAVRYGADAVYLAGTGYGLRAKAGNFGMDDLGEALSFLHSQGKKGYVTVNAYLRNAEFDGLREYLYNLESVRPDAMIVSDPGVFKVIRDMKLKTPVHISTQSNVTNLAAVDFWAELGAERVILARELSAEEIAYICKNAKAEIEVFVHGAMCISMSGRCLISNYMTGRDANAGMCTHPCRWKYSLVEETRPGEYFPVVEDERGTYFYNSKDLCLIEYIGELVKAGVKSIKIEGRMKSVMYVALVTGAYRQALDWAMADPDSYEAREEWVRMLKSVTHRSYTAGFYKGDTDSSSMNYANANYIQESEFLGSVENGEMLAKNKFLAGEELEFVTPFLEVLPYKVTNLTDEQGAPVEGTRPNYRYSMELPDELPDGSILRRWKV